MKPNRFLAVFHSGLRAARERAVFVTRVAIAFGACVTACSQAGPGNALDLKATNSSFVQVQPGASLTLSNRITLEAWVKPRAAKCSTIVSRGDGNNLSVTDYILQVGYDGTNCGVMKVALAASGVWDFSSATIPLDAWTHIAVTFDGLYKEFYINGALDRTVSRVGSLYQSGSPLYIGRQGSACACNFFDGQIDEVRIWNTNRSQAQIEADMGRRLAGTEAGLGTCYRLDEDGGILAVDATGNGNAGSLVNRPVRVRSTAPFPLTVLLSGTNPLTNQCVVAFSDPGAIVSAAPADVAAGAYHSLALKADGAVIGWGNNDDGQISIPANTTNVVALAAGGFHSLALDADYTVLGWGAQTNDIGVFPNFTQSIIPTIATNVVAVAAGLLHSLALRSDGTVVGWGYNYYGESTGVPTPDDPQISTGMVMIAGQTLSNIVAVAAGGSHSLALKADGTVVGWGYDFYGQITIPEGTTNIVAVVAAGDHSLALRANGTVVAWGDNSTGQTNVPANLTNVVALAGGDLHSLALRFDGTVVGWGDNSDGQTTTNASETNVVAIAAGCCHNLALKPNGTVIGWGNNSYGQTNTPANVANLNLAVTVNGVVNVDVPGIYSLTYSATNDAGAIGSATREVAVVCTIGTSPYIINPTLLANGSFQFAFTNVPDAAFTVLAATNLTLPLSNWTKLMTVSETPPGSGLFQFTDPQAINSARRFYLVRSP